MIARTDSLGKHANIFRNKTKKVGQAISRSNKIFMAWRSFAAIKILCARPALGLTRSYSDARKILQKEIYHFWRRGAKKITFWGWERCWRREFCINFHHYPGYRLRHVYTVHPNFRLVDCPRDASSARIQSHRNKFLLNKSKRSLFTARLTLKDSPDWQSWSWKIE